MSNIICDVNLIFYINKNKKLIILIIKFERYNNQYPHKLRTIYCVYFN